MSLEGLRVLIVEDEPIIAMTAEDMLDELGCTVAATVGSVDSALEAVEGDGFDVALLDINLNGRDSLPVADRLKALGRPFAFTTGYGAGGAAPGHREAPLLTKPYRLSELAATLRALAPEA